MTIRTRRSLRPNSAQAASRRACLAALLVAVLFGLPASVARADGDPGSDVLVYQNLYFGTDAGLSVQQQAQLGALLKTAARTGFPVRVAIIVSPFDLARSPVCGASRARTPASSDTSCRWPTSSGCWW